MHVHTCAGTCRAQKAALDPLELGIHDWVTWLSVNHHVGAGIQTGALYISSKDHFNHWAITPAHNYIILKELCVCVYVHIQVTTVVIRVEFDPLQLVF